MGEQERKIRYDYKNLGKKSGPINICSPEETEPHFF